MADSERLEPVEKRDLMIPQMLEGLVSVVEGLEEKITRIEERLTPVLSPPGPVSGEDENQSFEIPLAQKLYGITRRVEITRDKLQDLMDRLEI